MQTNFSYHEASTEFCNTMIDKKTLFLTCALAAVIGPATAQTNGSNTPYSRYGLGILADPAQSFNKGMAGTGIALRSNHELNFKNPASYSEIDSLTFIFDIGVSLQNANIVNGKSSTNAKNTSFDYLMAGYRIRKNLGMTLGLLPYSTVGYSMSTTSNLSNQDGTGTKTKTETYSGDGGIHELFAGLGWRPFKPISLGVNAGMLWGSLSNTVLASFSESSVNSLRRQYSADILSYKVDFGAQYEQRINSKNTLFLGFTYGLGHKINNRSHLYNQILTSSSTVSSGDSISVSNAYGLPNTYGVGLGWNYNERLRVAADYTFSQWSKVNYPQPVSTTSGQGYATSKGSLQDSHKFNFGIEYTPNPEGLHWRNYITYQAGFAFSTSYAKIQNNTNWQSGPNSYLASFGVKLPIITSYNNRSMVSLGVQYERIQPRYSNMIKENYIRFCIGLTFDERWFAKWKVE